MEVYESKVKKDPRAYLVFLQSQNRVKKQEEQLDKEKIINKQKEEAFNLYLQGANQERVDNQRKREKIKKLRDKSQGPSTRKQWSKEPAQLKINERIMNSHPDAFSPNLHNSNSQSSQKFKIPVFKPLPKSEKDQILDYLKDFNEENLLNVLDFINNLIL